jgi:hypothetical protein
MACPNKYLEHLAGAKSHEQNILRRKSFKIWEGNGINSDLGGEW